MEPGDVPHLRVVGVARVGGVRDGGAAREGERPALVGGRVDDVGDASVEARRGAATTAPPLLLVLPLQAARARAPAAPTAARHMILRLCMKGSASCRV